jgi:hypothetical protein
MLQCGQVKLDRQENSDTLIRWKIQGGFSPILLRIDVSANP